MKAGGGFKQDVSLVSRVRRYRLQLRDQAETTTRHRNTEKLNGDTYKPLYSPMPTKKEGKEGPGTTCHTNTRSEANSNCITSQSEYASSEAWRKPVCQIGLN